MAFKFENLLEDLGTPGIIAGIGAIVAAPFVIPALKPVTKAAIKGGIIVYEKGKAIVAETGELFEDLVAEAKAELDESRSQEEMASISPSEEAS
ncbi:MAG: DUF5132 domain-containing protein [Hydrococcus sp. Prado102]|jgi:hypothetical protein|nr:DUF5132 domain-containing protein [Hydrococcus sp. Prado102]